MNYDELTQQVEALKKEQREIERSIEAKIRRRDKKILDLKLQYIEEHQPLPLKRFQRIKVTARVTEESRKRMTADARNEEECALGATYTIVGAFDGYRIDDAGHVVPCLCGKADYRGWCDEILSVELTPSQPEGNCNKCLKAKDGFCYMAGGKERGPRYAAWKIDEDKMVPCPKYEEVVEGGLYGIKERIYPARYYPKVTRVKTKDGKWIYRLYEGNWHCFCEYDERHIKKYYTNEPQDYQEE
jgi:uncharacterized protein YlaN (UPF0358 family)